MLFPRPFLVSLRGGASADVKNEEEGETDGGKREREKEKEELEQDDVD